MLWSVTGMKFGAPLCCDLPASTVGRPLPSRPRSGVRTSRRLGSNAARVQLAASTCNSPESSATYWHSVLQYISLQLSQINLNASPQNLFQSLTFDARPLSGRYLDGEYPAYPTYSRGTTRSIENLQSWYNPRAIQVKSRCNPGTIHVLSRWKSRYNPGAIQVQSRCNQGANQVQSRYNTIICNKVYWNTLRGIARAP